MDIKKIVVGVDFSEESESAAKQALEIARHTGAELVLAHIGMVMEPAKHLGGAVHSGIKEWENMLRQELADSRRLLEEMRERLRGQGAEISHVVKDSFADTGLVDVARELGADLLIVGTHGRTGIKRFFLGSISERVVRLSTTNVMVARPTDRRGYRRIFVPTDFSQPAEAALELALRIAHDGATIDLVHFWQIPMTAATPYAPFKAAEEALTTVRHAMRDAAESAGTQVVERHGAANLEISFHAVEGAPAHGIQERLEEGDYDLVVMGSHGRRGLRRFLLGSVAETTVRHASCSVVVVHGSEDAAGEGAAPEQA